MPIGLQLIGRPFGDKTVIALGRAFRLPNRDEPSPPHSGLSMTPIVEVRDLRVRFTGGRTAYAVMWIAYRGPRCIETGQHRGLPLSRRHPRGTDCGSVGSAEPLVSRRR